jgi:plasmid stability protein
MRHLSIRSLPPHLAQALEQERERRHQSLNETVKQLLEAALGLDPEVPFDNGLRRLAGGWSKRELESFEKAMGAFETIDPEQWK